MNNKCYRAVINDGEFAIVLDEQKLCIEPRREWIDGEERYEYCYCDTEEEAEEQIKLRYLQKIEEANAAISKLTISTPSEEVGVEYFVAYTGVGPTGGIHNCWTTVTTEPGMTIRTGDHVEELHTHIEERGKFTDVVINNFIKLEGETG